MPDTTALKLKKISPRTIDRLLHKTKQQLKIRETAGAKPLHRAVPILTWLHYAQKPSGFFQIDLVLHDGGNPSAEFCYTLTMTDVKTGGTIHSDLLNQALPGSSRPSTGPYDVPRGSPGYPFRHRQEFINKLVGLRRRGADFSRRRPAHKAEQEFNAAHL
jgi:hypothetical protein